MVIPRWQRLDDGDRTVVLEIRLGSRVRRGCSSLVIVDESAGGRVIVGRRDGDARRRIGGGSVERRGHLEAVVAEGASLGGLTELVFGATACVKACAISSEFGFGETTTMGTAKARERVHE